MIQGRRDTWFTIEEFAEMIGRSNEWVVQKIKAGEIGVDSLGDTKDEKTGQSRGGRPSAVRLIRLSFVEDILLNERPPSTELQRSAWGILTAPDRRRSAAEKKMVDATQGSRSD